MRTAYFEELNNLYGRFISLGYKVKETIQVAVKAFEEEDVEAAYAIIEGDSVINELEAELEKDCIQIIALQQPVTGDLRKVITIIKASTDFERIADHARGVAYATKRMTEGRDSALKARLLEMAEIIDQMMTFVLQGIEEQNLLPAVQAAKLDDQVDQMNKKISRAVTDELLSEGKTSSVFLEYKSIASDLERIGDYITNISELVVYLETGEVSELNPRYTILEAEKHI